MQVTHTAVFLDRWRSRQPLPIHEALAGIGIDCEIADLKGGKILEEVAAL